MLLRVVATSVLVSAGLSWAQKPIQLADILSWKRIQTPAVSNNGEWLAYRIGPAGGDAEVVIRNLKSGKELRFPIGDPGASAPTPDGPPVAPVALTAGGGVALSGDSRWAAFQTWPNTKEAKKLKEGPQADSNQGGVGRTGDRQKNGDSIKTRRFSFAGEKSMAIALHRYPATAAAAPAIPPAAPTATGGAGPAADRPTGSDLLLYDLGTASELNLGNVSEFAFDKKGDWLACLIDAADKAGNGVVLRNMSTGALHSLDTAAAVYKGLNWTEKGDGLAVLRGVDDKGFEDKLYSVVAFKGFGPGGAPAKSVYDPEDPDKSFPSGMTISPTRNAAWREDLSAITFGIHEVKPKKTPPPIGDGEPKITVSAPGGPADAAGEDKPDLVLWHWKDSRLQTQQAVQEPMDKNFSYLSVWRPGDGKFVRLADDSVRAVTFPAESKVALGTDVREYELMGNLDGRRFEDDIRGRPDDRGTQTGAPQGALVPWRVAGQAT